MKERWKRSYELDPELPLEEDRVELTKHQKMYLDRAWVYSFGFLPNAIPVYNERQGFFHTPGIAVQFHHILPIQESLRIFGEGSYFYNDKRNIVPVSALNHIGQGADEFDWVVHNDMRGIGIQYGAFREGRGDNPYKTMHLTRRQLTDAGLPYHEIDYDMYLLDLADRVISRYEIACPEDIY